MIVLATDVTKGENLFLPGVNDVVSHSQNLREVRGYGYPHFLEVGVPYPPLFGCMTEKLEIISTLLRRIGIPPPTVAPWRVALYKDRQSNRRVAVF